MWQLARAVDDLRLPVMCYGLRVDFRGEAFPRKSGKAADDDDDKEEEQEDELAELEKQRLRNIERNQEMLRALGLA